ncbi:MAG: hypothetical protein ACI936_001719 [Paraglaciecola sp.]|jgi:hypothetical protein
MEISSVVNNFELFIAAQQSAILAIKEIASLDRKLANSLFGISSFDASVLTQLDDELVSTVATVNSALFSIRTPSYVQVQKELSNQPLAGFIYASELVKNTVLKYRDAQLSALLSMKSLINIDSKLSGLLIDVDKESIDVIHQLTTLEIVNFAQRYAWVFRLNYHVRNNIFTETAEVRKHTRAFVESTLIY